MKNPPYRPTKHDPFTCDLIQEAKEKMGKIEDINRNTDREVNFNYVSRRLLSLRRRQCSNDIRRMGQAQPPPDKEQPKDIS